MQPQTNELLTLLEVEQLETNLFRGKSRDIGSAQVFGGQVLGQALTAAARTIDGRVVHSLHAYFLRRGDFNAPIVYEVERSRDGGSFSNRRVVAVQHGQQIFNMTASFQTPQSGLEHQTHMPDVPLPEDLPDMLEVLAPMIDRLPDRVRNFFEKRRPFEFRMVQPIDPVAPHKHPPMRQVWLRLADRIADDQALHCQLLAYVSDYYLLDTATLPHGASYFSPAMTMASIDHVMWFHRPFRVDEWNLYAIDSPSASGTRGFGRGTVFSRDGKLVASTAQEGLVRIAQQSGVSRPTAISAARELVSA
jgi:acyl-CoA thioesterase-2